MAICAQSLKRIRGWQGYRCSEGRDFLVVNSQRTPWKEVGQEGGTGGSKLLRNFEEAEGGFMMPLLHPWSSKDLEEVFYNIN